MALPASREETATPAGPVRSNTINAIQDAIIASVATLRTMLIPSTGFVESGGGTAPQHYSRGSKCVGQSVAVPVVTGMRILAVRAYVQDMVGTPMVATLNRNTSLASGTVIATTNTSASSGAEQTISATGLTHVVTAGGAYVVDVGFASGAGTDLWCSRVEIDWDQLP